MIIVLNLILEKDFRPNKLNNGIPCLIFVGLSTTFFFINLVKSLEVKLFFNTLFSYWKFKSLIRLLGEVSVKQMLLEEGFLMLIKAN